MQLLRTDARPWAEAEIAPRFQNRPDQSEIRYQHFSKPDERQCNH